MVVAYHNILQLKLRVTVILYGELVLGGSSGGILGFVLSQSIGLAVNANYASFIIVRTLTLIASTAANMHASTGRNRNADDLV